MKITFLGTGTSTGIPMIGCHCPVCLSEDPYDKRLRTSAFIEKDRTKILIDTTPDLRTQLLRENKDNIDAVLLTHYHKDHINGLDDLRAVIFKYNKSIPVYTNTDTLAVICREYAYANFNTNLSAYTGLALNLYNIENKSVQIGSIKIEPIKIWHGALPILGFLLDNTLAYITDAKTIDKDELEKLKNIPLLILNALRIKPHDSHLNLSEAIALADKIKAKKTYFTHISHHLGTHEKVSKMLPKNIHLTYDGLSISDF